MYSKWITALLAITLLSPLLKFVDSDASATSASAKDDQHVPSSSSSSSSPSASSSSDTSSSIPSLNSPDLLEHLSEMGSIIPGVYKEYLPQPIFYESTVPVIFQYQTPLWNKTEITFNNWYTCISETVPYRYSCPVTFHMNKAIVNLHTDFEGLHPISDLRLQTLQASLKQYYTRLTAHSEFCDRIQPHFFGIWTESSDLQKYLNGLQGCSRGSDLHPIIDRSITDYNYSIRQPFTKMENNFYNTFYKHILGSGGKNSSLDLVASALLSNTRTSLQAAILGHYYAEKNRWIHANEDCRQSYIPTSLISPQKFNESLSAILKMKVFHNNQYDLSISPAQISKYYSLPLADCTHTSDSFVARVLVPLLKKFRAEVLQLVHVHSIPFQYKDHICRVKLPQEPQGDEEKIIGGGHSGGSGSMYIYHELSHLAYRTTCKPNELCKISEYLLDSRRSDPCVSALLSRNDTGIRTFCDFECRPKDDYILPSVVRVATNKFVVTGNSVTLRISCGKIVEKNKLVYVKEDHVGAMMVKLGCHCKLIFPHFNVFYGGRSCDPGEEELGADHYTRIVNSDEDPNFVPDELTVTSIIPFMFGKLKGSRGLVPEYQQEHRSANSVHETGNENRDPGYFYDNLAEGMVFNLTEIIDPGRIENYIRSSEIRRENDKKMKGFKGMDFYAEKLQSGESLYENERGSGGAGGGGFFWSLFVISVVIVLGLQVYIIVMFKRHQMISYRRDDRILYRVEPDDAASLHGEVCS